MLRKLAEEPLVQVEYVSVCDPDSLAPLGHITGRVVLLGAIRLGQVRLIDNLLIKAKKTSRRPRSH